MITHLEPDILECEVKWALESITTNKASGGDGIPVELFQIMKDDAVKVLHSICQQIWKTQQWQQEWKRPVFIPIPKEGNAKECSNYHTIAFISHANKVMLKILQARLQQYVNCELPDIQAGQTHGHQCMTSCLNGLNGWKVPEKSSHIHNSDLMSSCSWITRNHRMLCEKSWFCLKTLILQGQKLRSRRSHMEHKSRSHGSWSK